MDKVISEIELIPKGNDSIKVVLNAGETIEEGIERARKELGYRSADIDLLHEIQQGNLRIYDGFLIDDNNMRIETTVHVRFKKCSL